MSTLLDTALRAAGLGYCVLPVSTNGRKQPWPGTPKWTRYKQERPTAEQLRGWLGDGCYDGVGVVCGTISGGLELLELEGRAVAARLDRDLEHAADRAGLRQLLERVRDGYEERTPSGGVHWFYRCTETKNDKLAYRVGTNGSELLIETKGEGGFVVVAPSAGRTHPTGRGWVLLRGGFDTIVTITPDERAALHDLCRQFDERPARSAQPAASTRTAPAGDRPGDAYNATTTWEEVLEPEGWAKVYTHGTETTWRRPGKADGISATTNHNGTDHLKVFSTSTPFDTETTYDRFGAYAVLHHQGDLAAAARTLAANGYGTRSCTTRPAPTAPPDPTDTLDDEPTDTLDDEPTDVGLFVNWTDFWARDRRHSDWLYEPILARGRAHAIYASHKTGKSLLLLWLATQLLDREDTVVIYLDYEMTEDDLWERLADMGYGPDTSLDRLRYALLPSLPPLDTAEGGRAVLDLVDQVAADHPAHHLAVIIDTTGRAVEGPEDSADTFRAFARHTGLGLKQRGVTWARSDHGGKDASRGQRGSSAKGDDVDVIWSLKATDSGLTMKRDAARMSWIPDKVGLHRRLAPLRFEVTDEAWPSGTEECAAVLTLLDVPTEWGERKVRPLLREHGYTCSTEVLRAGMRYRRTATTQEDVA